MVWEAMMILWVYIFVIYTYSNHLVIYIDEVSNFCGQVDPQNP